MIKSLVLFSGGLDSLLAVKILESQNIEVEGICFVSNFFGCKKAQKVAHRNKIKLHIQDISEKMVNLVKNPESRFGKNMNPCVDCHALMIKLAGEFAKEKGFDLVATGEVLGQRPFSQNAKALEQVQKKAGVEVLRPLSAKLLKETSMEKQGLVNRKGLLGIQGRRREGQINLASEMGIEEYDSPGGGCLLTDPEFSKRLSEMKRKDSNFRSEDVELLKWGRVFWFDFQDNKALFVIGREKKDNDKLEGFFSKGDLIVKPETVTGPVVLIRGLNQNIQNKYDIKKTEKVSIQVPNELDTENFSYKKIETTRYLLETAALLAGWFSVKGRGRKIAFNVKTGE